MIKASIAAAIQTKDRVWMTAGRKEFEPTRNVIFSLKNDMVSDVEINLQLCIHNECFTTDFGHIQLKQYIIYYKMAFELTDSNFKEKVMDHEGIAVVDFWAEWCGPCRMIGPHIEEMAKEYDGKALIAKVNVDSNPEISYKYGVRSIPTVLYLKNGEVVDKQVGATSKKVLSDKLDAILA